MRKYLLLGIVAAIALTGFALPARAVAVEPSRSVIAGKADTEGRRGRRNRWGGRRGGRRGGGLSFGFNFGSPRRYAAPRYYYVQPQPPVVYAQPGATYYPSPYYGGAVVCP